MSQGEHLEAVATMSVNTPLIDERDPGEPATRAELEEALTNMARTAARMPTHWADRRAAIHARMNLLLDLLDQTPA